MGCSPRTRRRAWPVAAAAAAVAVAVGVAVAAFGELSTGALVVVGVAGLLTAAVGLARSAGAAGPPVGRRSLPWLGWLAVALVWEAVTLLHDGLPTPSDLADPVLAHPPVRAAATVAWLGAGAWLVTRPGSRSDQR